MKGPSHWKLGNGERGKGEASLYDFTGVGAGPATPALAGPHFTNCEMPSHIDISADYTFPLTGSCRGCTRDRMELGRLEACKQVIRWLVAGG